MTDGAAGAPLPGGDPAKVALVCGERNLTFAALGERAARVQAVLGGKGLGAGSRIAAMLPNSTGFFEVGLGAARAGIEVVPVNWHLKADEVAWMVADSGASLLVAAASLGPVATACVEQVPGSSLLLVSDDDLGDGSAAGGPWKAPAYLYFTSGTTGRPRAVERDTAADHEQMLAGLAALWGLGRDDVYLACSPLYHAANAYAYATLFQGGRVVVMESWDPREWLRLVERHRVTACFMVPAHFIRLLELPESERRAHDTSSLRLILHAAAPCPEPVKWRMLEELPSAEIWEFYGATEGGATRISGTEWRGRPGSVGKPWPGTEVFVLDDAGNRLGPGQTGTIYIRPPNTGRFQYRNDPAKTGQAWAKDAFTVGDVGHLDADGYLYVTDRASDMVLRGGVNVYPAEVEAVLQRHRDVVDCAVLGVPDTRMGEELLALVELRRPASGAAASPSPAELQRFCREHLADFKCPRRVEIVEHLPRDATGKVLKRRLRDQRRASLK